MNDRVSQSIKSQLDKLEKISNQISLLISAGEYGKINHLDKMRKKIINDMSSCNYSFENENKKSIKFANEQWFKCNFFVSQRCYCKISYN